MKDFLLTFVICLVTLFVFFFFGGFIILENFYLALILAALITALVIFAFSRQAEKIAKLEERVEILENEKKGS